jgi:hypothetical protein
LLFNNYIPAEVVLVLVTRGAKKFSGRSYGMKTIKVSQAIQAVATFFVGVK